MFELEEKPEVESPTEPEKPTEGELERIRVLMASPEPIATKNGEELTLEEGDIHFVDAETASWLIDSGVAEAAAL
jgi:hypothetical protein